MSYSPDRTCSVLEGPEVKAGSLVKTIFDFVGTGMKKDSIGLVLEQGTWAEPYVYTCKVLFVEPTETKIIVVDTYFLDLI